MWTDRARHDYRVLEEARADLASELTAAHHRHDRERVRHITGRQEELARRQQNIIYQMNAPTHPGTRAPRPRHEPAKADPSPQTVFHRTTEPAAVPPCSSASSAQQP